LEERAQEVVKVVGSWWITESVCAYITGREKGIDFETILLERGTVGLARNGSWSLCSASRLG